MVGSHLERMDFRRLLKNGESFPSLHCLSSWGSQLLGFLVALCLGKTYSIHYSTSMISKGNPNSSIVTIQLQGLTIALCRRVVMSFNSSTSILSKVNPKVTRPRHFWLGRRGRLGGVTFRIHRVYQFQSLFEAFFLAVPCSINLSTSCISKAGSTCPQTWNCTSRLPCNTLSGSSAFHEPVHLQQHQSYAKRGHFWNPSSRHYCSILSWCTAFH